MKKLLSFLIVATLTTSTGISVVACGKELVESGSQAEISTKILENLGLVDEEGKGLKEVVLKWNENEPYFDVDQERIKLTDLLVDQDQELAKAIDEASFDFLRDLKIELKEGTTFEDGLFEVEEVSSIKAKTTDVQIVTAKNEEELIVESGTYNLQFFNVDSSKALSENHEIRIKAGTNALFGIFSLNESMDPIRLGYDEFVYEGSAIEEFHIGGIASNVDKWYDEKTIIHVMSENETAKAQKLNQFQKLIGWEITFQVSRYFVSRPNLEKGNDLSLVITLTRDDQTILFSEFKKRVLITLA